MRLAPRGPSNTLSLVGYGDYVCSRICSLIELLKSGRTQNRFLALISNGTCPDWKKVSQQHPKDFPGGHPPQYYPGLARLNFGVRKGSGAFHAVWPLTRNLLLLIAPTLPAAHSSTVVRSMIDTTSPYLYPTIKRPCGLRLEGRVIP